MQHVDCHVTVDLKLVPPLGVNYYVILLQYTRIEIAHPESLQVRLGTIPTANWKRLCCHEIGVASDVKNASKYNTLPAFRTQQQLLLCTFLANCLLQAIHPSSFADVSI